MRFFLSMVVVLFVSASGWTQDATDTDDEAAIRRARAASNTAIREHDAETVASFWAQDYHVVTSTNAQVRGKEENQESLAAHFRERPDVVYLRTPGEIGLYDPWGMAYEIGTWEGGWSEGSGRITIGGTYLAKWQKTGARWLILAEIFVPTHCDGGPYCDQLP